MRPVPAGVGVTLGYRQPMKSRPTYVHRGIDYGTPLGTPVTATVAGKVVHAGRGGMGSAFGIHVVILTAGVWHIYAHLSMSKVKKGQLVDAGQRLGLSGASGNVTGPHLHYGEFTRYSYLADRRPKFIDVEPGGGKHLETSIYVQNFASKRAKWSTRVKTHAAEILAADASFVVCTELYAAQRPALTRLIKDRYQVGAVNGGRVIYYRRGRWARIGAYRNGKVGSSKKRVTGAKFAHAETGKRANIVGAHLTWQHNRGQHRRAETAGLLAWGAKTFPDNRRIYAGDFNAPAKARGRADEVGPIMRAKGWHDAADDVATASSYRLDRVFGGDSVDFTGVRMVDHGASDPVHPGAAVRLRFPL